MPAPSRRRSGQHPRLPRLARIDGALRAGSIRHDPDSYGSTTGVHEALLNRETGHVDGQRSRLTNKPVCRQLPTPADSSVNNRGLMTKRGCVQMAANRRRAGMVATDGRHYRRCFLQRTETSAGDRGLIPLDVADGPRMNGLVSPESARVAALRPCRKTASIPPQRNR